MSYKNSSEVMNRVMEHLKILMEKGYEVVFIAHQGSFNYGLGYEGSDVDTKAIVLPSFEDVCYNRAPISTTLVLKNDEHIDVKDIRVMFDMFKKENISYLELLYSPFRVVVDPYADLFQKVLERRDDIVNANKNQFLKCISGMSMEKCKALCHPYPNLIDKIEKYGFDGKQLSHCVRLYEFISRYVKGEPIVDCYYSTMREALINLKLNKNVNGEGFMDVELAKKMCTLYDNLTKTIKDSYISEDNKVNTEVYDFLNKIKYELLKMKFKQDLT